jgi:hypothetical protein
MMRSKIVEQHFASVQDGHVVATVQWRKWGAETQAHVYAPTYELAALLPADVDGARQVSQVSDLLRAKRLFPVSALFQRLTRCYRIDDRRPGRDHSYMFWAGDSREPAKPTLFKNRLYHYWEPTAVPRLRTVEQVRALITEPGTLVVSKVDGELAGRDVHDPAVEVKINTGGRVTVWDLSSIYG